ncbi:VOC family protein [Robiginitalea sp. M366]|uniref:bleomycin resistance protein n=1 Tax=Robiginitalea aestuariiviva TaxID=3036903 RepID=UPI00240D8579|nr:VOC family protein [Robiginitalea aestuariiviva]MDG1573320.1 VOC family protein [Robiginitalea aestuariiviva]
MSELLQICPKLPMRNPAQTRAYYEALGFALLGEYPDYLMMGRGGVEIHFFAFKDLDPPENYGQVYIRTRGIDALYRDVQERGVSIHPNGPLEDKPWGQREFSLLDPDHNLLTFGQPLPG